MKNKNIFYDFCWIMIESFVFIIGRSFYFIIVYDVYNETLIDVHQKGAGTKKKPLLEIVL